MITVTKIPVSDMPEKKHGRYRRYPDYEAVKALGVGEAIKFPCRWLHTQSRKRGQCHGVLYIYKIVKKRGVRVDTVCKDAWVYVHVVGKRGA